jgi:DNA-binding protein HU-beta
VNKSELVDHVAAAAGIEKKQADAALSAAFDAVISETKAGRKVSLAGFGIFNPTKRAARTGRNPQTGATIKIAASKGVGFKPAQAYKDALNGKKAAAKKAPAKKAAAKKSSAKPTKKAAKAAKKR